MSIDPKTLPEGTVVQTNGCTLRYMNGVYNPEYKGHEVTHVYVPVPDGMTVEDAEKALADAHPDRAIEEAIDAALPDGSWTPAEVLANLRAWGFDVVKAGAR